MATCDDKSCPIYRVWYDNRCGLWKNIEDCDKYLATNKGDRNMTDWKDTKTGGIIKVGHDEKESISNNIKPCPLPACRSSDIIDKGFGIQCKKCGLWLGDNSCHGSKTYKDIWNDR